MKTDVLIVGQGLAGSLLAMALLKLGKRVLVLDDGWRSAASLAASGVINPVSGQRLARDPELDSLLPAAVETYGALSRDFRHQLIQASPLLRLVQSEDEAMRLKQRSTDPGYEALLGPWQTPTDLPTQLNAPLGGFEQLQVHLVDIAQVLRLIRGHLLEQGLLIDEAFDSDALAFGPHGLSYGQHQAEALVFCEGHKVCSNPWFGALPWQPAKGESLLLSLASPLPAHILSAGVGLIPLGHDRYRLGSSYQHDWRDPGPDPAIRAELLKGLERLFKHPPTYQVLDHLAGIRPAAAGSRPLIGRHPLQPRLHLFNGFGSKGVLLIPGYARRFALELSRTLHQPCHQAGASPEGLHLDRHLGLFVDHR